MRISTRSVSHLRTPAYTRDGAPFVYARTIVELWTDAATPSQQGKALAETLRKLKLPHHQCEPLHVEAAYDLQGDPCGFIISGAIA